MPRLTNSVPKYRFHRASGQAVVTLNGRDFYLGPYGTIASRREYDRLIGEWATGGRQLPSQVFDITIVELIAQYLKWAQAYYQRDGKSTRVTPGIKCALRYLRQSYGDIAAAQFSPLKLKALRKRMIADGLARAYINQHCDWIKRCFRWGATEELVPASVPQALVMLRGLVRGKTIAPERPPVKPVADEVVDVTLPHLPAVVADMVRLHRVTGMRPGEVVIVRPMDVDRSEDVWLYRPASHKNLERGKPRVVCIGLQGQSVLSKYLLRPADQFCFKPSESELHRRAAAREKRVTPMSCGNRPGSNQRRRPKRKPGDRYTTQSYGRAVRRGRQKAGVSPWSPNQLRHSMGTLVREEFGLESAQAVLGHSNLQTSQIYAVVNLQRAIEVARKLG